MLQLVVVEPHGPQWRLTLEGTEYIIGRDAEAAISLADARVSRRHARLRRTADGSYTIEDMGSSNGVQIKGVSITGATRLEPGTEVEICGFKLNFVHAPVESTDNSPARFTLVGPTTGSSSKRTPLRLGRVSIGRDMDNTLALDDNSLSRHHAVLWIEPQGITLEDLRSSNGSFVDGIRVERQTLNKACKLTFGSVDFQLEDAGGGKAGLGNILKRRNVIVAASVIVLIAGGAWATRLALKAHRHHEATQPARSQSPLAQRYEAEVKERMHSAQDKAKSQAWEDAAKAFNAVLDLDPIHIEARAGLIQAEQNRDQFNKITEAGKALSENKPARALQLVSSISSQAFYGSAADDITEKARAALTRQTQEAANRACLVGKWRECHENAAILLTYMPQSVVGSALAYEAEDALATQHISFARLSNTSSTSSASHTRALHHAYPDRDVRQAILRYASGDFATAEKRLRNFAHRRHAKHARVQLTAFRVAKNAGDGAAVAGDARRAFTAWGHAVGIDGHLVNSGPSVLGSELRHRIAAEHLHIGSGAFDRGLYSEAFSHWHEGLLADPHNNDLAAVLSKLESRASGLLAGIPDGPRLESPMCDRLKEVMAITLPQSGPHQLAKAKLTHCR